ncbi:sulfotransferase 2B1-like [Cheilinus undulatus]|uniref:sulfotransferase 2B1-like n=1 Tax=Cheilinus undulatus TaxID=241271 RepID=UPI001BD6408F|nr:sulfotransferase 2B1-like [Cheilinus undulatus]
MLLNAPYERPLSVLCRLSLLSLRVNPPNTMSSEEMHVLYQGILLPKENFSLESLKFAQEFTFKDDDVVAALYPKSGTIWMQEILPLLLNGGDMTPIQTIPNWDRAPWLAKKRLEQIVDKLASPRALVSHLPYHLMPPSLHSSKAKVIYVMRNPKDALVSSYFYHQMAGFLPDPGTFDEFITKFLEGRVMFGKWTDHVKSWRQTELGDRIMYITYEEMVQDLPAALRRMSDFLGRDLSEETIKKISEHCSFQSMKQNNMSNFSLVPKVYMDQDKSPFFRKGVVGDWRNHFNSEQEARFTSVIKKELEKESFTLPWSLD